MAENECALPKNVFWLNLVDRGRVRIRPGAQIAKENDLFITFAEALNWKALDPGTEVISARISGSAVTEILRRLDLTPQKPVRTLHDPRKIRELLAETRSRDIESEGQQVRRMRLICSFLAFLAEDVLYYSINSKVRSAVDYIVSHFSETISIEHLAQMLHLNNNYFTKLFKRELGITPMQLVNQLRLQKAEAFLSYTNESIQNVATEVGYADMRYFSRIFRRQSGYSPTQYRRSRWRNDLRISLIDTIKERQEG